MKKIFSILFALVLVLSFSLVTVPVAAATLEVGDGKPYTSIQAAIDAAVAGDIIVVYYSLSPYEEDLVIPIGKDNLELKPASGESVTIKGVQNVDAAAFPLALPNIEILADGVKIHGFNIQGPDWEFDKYSSGMVIGGDNVEIYGNDFEATPADTFDEISQTIQTYRDGNNPTGGDVDGLNIHGNTFSALSDRTAGYEGIFINHTLGDPAPAGNVTIADNNFTGKVIRAITTERSNTIISGNTIVTNLVPGGANPGDAFQGILARDFDSRDQDNVQITDNTAKGSATGKGFKHGIRIGSASQTVTNVTVSGNTLENNDFQVYDPAEALDMASVLANNTFDRAVTVDHPGASLLHTIWSKIQDGIAAAVADDTINVAAGTYVEVDQIVIGNNLTIMGEDKETTVIKPAQNTGVSGDARGWFLVQAGNEFNLSNVTLDGEGKDVYQAIRSHGSGTINNNIIKNIGYSQYIGFGMVVMGNYDMTFSDNTFTNIQRIGMMAYGSGVTNAQIIGNTYTGKGAGDWLDYGIEIGGGAKATITDNDITNCLGVASSDGSTSAGILVTTYYGAGTEATITGNTLTNNTGGIAVGYDADDTSTVVAHYNNIYENTDYGIDTTAPLVGALYNWWGDETGPDHDTRNPGGQGDAVSDNVDFSPWLYKTQEQFVSGEPCYAGSVVLANEATAVGNSSYAGGWNSFSTPVILDDSADTVGEILALTTGSGLFIERAQRFDLASQAWIPVIMGNTEAEDYQIKPSEGLFIQVSSKGSLPILVETVPTWPPMRDLVAGWNLIGMSSLEAQNVTTALTGVDYSMVLSAKPPNDEAWSVPPDNATEKKLQLGEAYWVAMGEPGILFGFTTTPVTDDMIWDLNQ